MTIRVQRPRFYEGQYLGAADLTAGLEYERAQLAAHTLAGHSWGIAVGLHILEQPSASDPSRIDVFVSPGFAWDGFGRSIVVNDPVPVSPDLFRELEYDPVLDDKAANEAKTDGRRVPLWLRYTETATTPPRPGFQLCTDADQSGRIDESFRVVAGERTPSEAHDRVRIAGRQVDPEEAQTSFEPAGKRIWDASVPHQAMPGTGERALWFVPIGNVRWLPDQTLGQPGTFVARPQADLDANRSARRYAGLVGESVQAADGVLRLRERSADPSPLWSEDLVWVEGSMRLQGPARMFGTDIEWLTASGRDDDVPLQVRRVGGADGTTTLQAVIGKGSNGSTRFGVGPLASGAVSEKLTVRDDGRVGIGTTDPQLTLDIRGDFGRQDGAATLNLFGSRIGDVGGGILFVRSGGGTVTFDGGDKVGIGSTTPQNALAVRGIGDNEELVSFEDKNGVTRWHMNQHLEGHEGLNFTETNVANGRLFLAKGGRVGIGTMEPNLQLDIRGDFGRIDGPSTMHLWGSTIGDVGNGILFLRSAGSTVVFDAGDNVGIGVPWGIPVRSRLDVRGSINGDAGNINSHVAVIENENTGNSPDVLALVVGSQPATGNNNFITFFQGTTSIGRIEGNGSNGVSFLSGAGDFAEYLPLADPAEVLRPGDVVGIHAGRVSKATAGAHHVRVVSEHPIVAGGVPMDGAEGTHALVAFIGQVPCRVRGAVRAGDLLVPSGAGDGTAIARRARRHRSGAQVVGTAWEPFPGDGIGMVRTAVGLAATSATGLRPRGSRRRLS